MDPIGPGNHDRAWNDPPKFAFNSGSGGGVAGRRKMMNKRVAMPTGSTGSTPSTQPVLRPTDTPPLKGSVPPRGPPPGPPPSAPPPSALPRGPPPSAPPRGPPPSAPPRGPPPSAPPRGPPPSAPPRGPPPTSSVPPLGPPSSAAPPCGTPPSSAVPPCDTPTDTTDSAHTSEEMLREVETILNATLKSLEGRVKNPDIISQKISLLVDMWKGDNFNAMVQKRIFALCKGLVKGEYDCAWQLHQGLIVDFTSLCSPWMVGVKTLISEARTRKVEEDKGGDEEKGEDKGGNEEKEGNKEEKDGNKEEKEEKGENKEEKEGNKEEKEGNKEEKEEKGENKEEKEGNKEEKEGNKEEKDENKGIIGEDKREKEENSEGPEENTSELSLKGLKISEDTNTEKN